MGLEEEGDGVDEGYPGDGSGITWGGRRGSGRVSNDKVWIFPSARDFANISLGAWSKRGSEPIFWLLKACAGF